jgi:phenylacetate-CoA ligase
MELEKQSSEPNISAQPSPCPGLAEVLPSWLDRAPIYGGAAYRALPRKQPYNGEWHALPLITKQDIKHHFPENFLGSSIRLEDLLASDRAELEHTSGTSEDRTPLLLPAGWWSEQEGRAFRLNAQVREVLAQHPGARRVSIVSPMCSNDICYTGVPSRSERVVGSSLFVALSRQPFLWSEREMARMVEEVRDWDPLFLDTAPSYAVAWALYCERNGVRLPSLKFILGSYEFVSVNHRRVLERVFGVPVHNLYGSTETGHLLMQDETGHLRPSRETACLEMVNTDDRGVGELVVTTLSNDLMPLIRYRIGDLVEMRETPAGPGYLVHGRAADAIRLADGSRVTVMDVDRQFEGLPGVAHYQLARLSATWRLRVIPDNGGMPAITAEELSVRLRRLLGGETVTVETASMLLPEKSGKFRLVYPGPQPFIALA